MDDNCPSTPLRVQPGRNSKSPNLAISSPESDGRKSPASRLSPDTRCAICLGKLNNKAFTDICLHQFCFQCLMQWSKVKAECPLCKQPIKSIIYNVRSNLDYDQYTIERRDPAYVVSEILHSYDFDLVPVDTRVHYRSTMTREYFGELGFLAGATPSYQVPNFVPPPNFHIPPSSTFTPASERRASRRGSDFRKRIYEEDLWVRTLADVSGRYRECTPQFYRENPAQIHRIIPWLNREINSLMDDNESYSAYILDRILSFLPQYPIRSLEFRSIVEPYFGFRTDHFIHEFYTFCRSVYDINGFDQHASYAQNPNYGTEVQEISSSSSSSSSSTTTTDDDSDIEVIRTFVEGNSTATSKRRVWTKKSTRTTATKSIGTTATKSTGTTATNSTTATKSTETTATNSNEPVAGPSGIKNATRSEPVQVKDDNDDNDDIKIIEYVKPEPEVIIISSGDDEVPSSSGIHRNKSMKKSRPEDKDSDDTSSESSGFSRKRIGSRKRKNKPKPGNLEELKKKYFRQFSETSADNSSSSTTSVSSLASAIRFKEVCERGDLNNLAGQSFHNDSVSYSSSNESVTGSDVEQRSKMKRKKLSKTQNKKLKRTRSPASQLPVHNHDNARKNKIKSCVVVPRSERNTEMPHTCTRNGETSSHHSGNSRTEYEVPSYWSLMLNKNPENPWWKRNN